MRSVDVALLGNESSIHSLPLLGFDMISLSAIASGGAFAVVAFAAESAVAGGAVDEADADGVADDAAAVVVVVELAVTAAIAGSGAGKAFAVPGVRIVVTRQTSSASPGSFAHEAPLASAPNPVQAMIAPSASRRLTSSPALFSFAEASVTTRNPGIVTGVPVAIVAILPWPS